MTNNCSIEKIRKIVSEIGGVASALQMMAESDEELQYQVQYEHQNHLVTRSPQLVPHFESDLIVLRVPNWLRILQLVAGTEKICTIKEW